MKLIIEHLDLTPLPHSAEHCDHSPHEDHSPLTLQESYAKSFKIIRIAKYSVLSIVMLGEHSPCLNFKRGENMGWKFLYLLTKSNLY